MSLGQPLVKMLVCRNSVRVMLGLEGSNKDGVGFTVPADHDILVAAARTRCEATSVIREDVVDWDDLQVNAIGGWFGGGCWSWYDWWCLHGSDVLARLCHVSHVGRI